MKEKSSKLRLRELIKRYTECLKNTKTPQCFCSSSGDLKSNALGIIKDSVVLFEVFTNKI